MFALSKVYIVLHEVEDKTFRVFFNVFFIQFSDKSKFNEKHVFAEKKTSQTAMFIFMCLFNQGKRFV